MRAPELDGPTTPAADPRGFDRLLREFPRQVRAAARATEGLRLPAPTRGLVVAGVGGSAAAGDLLQALCHDRAPFPVQVVRGYRPPAWVGPGTLVVAVSYSGETEETLAAFEAARARGAALAVVTSGGTLGRRALALGVPWARVPAGLPPRAALAHLLMPLADALVALGALPPDTADPDEAAAVLEGWLAELTPEVPTACNPAKDLASWLVGHTPVVYGTELTAAAAGRWRTQVEENAKQLALAGALPEIDHNAIEAWGTQPGPGWRVVFLRDPEDAPPVARRVELTRAVLAPHTPTREVWARGRGRLARLLSLTYLGDWVSYYLACLRGVDPWAVPILEGLKRRLAEAAPQGPGQPGVGLAPVAPGSSP